jgi:transposase
MKWPSQFPDLNPIEHLWEEVERRIRCQNFRNKNELMEKIQEVWNEIPQSTLDKLIDFYAKKVRRCDKK